MSITKSVGFATPFSNTGSVKFSSRIDWFQGVLKLSSLEFQSLLGELASTFKDTFAADGGYLFVGRSFDHHRVSDRGCRVGWNIATLKNDDCDRHQLDEKNYDVWVMIPAKFINGCSSTFELRRFIVLLDKWGFKPTRLDLAIDDYTKSLTWKNFDDARKSGLHHGFKKGRLTSSFGDELGDGFTYYMGSTGSDKMTRFYDKNVESNGEVDAYRLEVQFRDDWCKSVWGCLLRSVNSDEKFHQSIVDCVTSAIDFYDKDDDGNKHYLDWWVAFKQMVKACGVTLSSGRVEPSINRSMEWIEEQVETTLANIQNYMDRIGDDFCSWLMSRIESGRERLRSVHQNKIDSALAVAGIPSHISGEELREGWF